MGHLYRLISPYDHLGMASLMYVDESKQKAVFFWWKTEHFYNQHFPRVTMAGLDPAKSYRVRELNRIDEKPLKWDGKVFTGEFLMTNGIEIPYNYSDWQNGCDLSSHVIYLEAQ